MTRLIDGNAMLTVVVSTTARTDAVDNGASAVRGLSSVRAAEVS
jgi:hypothetical protein